MKKKTMILLAGALCTVSMFVGAGAAGVIQEIKAQLRPDFTVKIDGTEKEFKNANGEAVYPLLYNGTTYLPLRAIGELMGKTVYWYEDDKRIELKEETTTVTDADVIVSGSAETGEPKSEKDKNKKEKQPIDTSAFIGEEAAKALVLEKAGLTQDEVFFDKVELDKDGGVYHYEVEFRNGFTEYDADVKADDGTIISWEVDRD